MAKNEPAIFQDTVCTCVATRVPPTIRIITKLRSETKETTLRVGHFTTVSGYTFANYINNFHKTEDLTVILTCTTLKTLH